MDLFLIENKKVPWGDWGEVLWFGFAKYDYKSGKIYMERVGPFSPPLYFTNGEDILLVTDEVKNSMEHYGLTGIRFRYKVEKRKLVNIDWSSWNAQDSISNYIDVLFEPEDIIERGIHDDSLTSIMPDYWLAEIENKVNIHINRDSKSENPSDYLSINNEVNENIDFFQGIERLGCFVSQKMKNWLDDNYPNIFDSYLITDDKNNRN